MLFFVLQDLKPKDIVSRASFENAMVTVMALGGSTNAVLHLIAMAKAFDIELTIDDFQSVSVQTKEACPAVGATIRDCIQGLQSPIAIRDCKYGLQLGVAVLSPNMLSLTGLLN